MNANSKTISYIDSTAAKSLFEELCNMLYATRIAYPKSQTERGYPTAQTLFCDAICFSG